MSGNSEDLAILIPALVVARRYHFAMGDRHLSTSPEIPVPSDGRPRRGRSIFLLAVAATFAALVLLHRPIAQPQSYHHFADARTLLGILNFWNVVSNAGFLIVAAAGLIRLFSSKAPGVLLPLRPSFVIFFIGSGLVAFGSGYYHWSPSDTTLVWDRAPMTIAITALFAIVTGEHLSLHLGRRLLAPLLLAGIASVAYWSLSGDLRPYILVQFLPIVLIPLIVLLMPSSFAGFNFTWGLLGAYVVAKICELYDGEIFSLTRQISGHTLKHCIAAAGMWSVVRAVNRPRRRPESETALL